MSITPREFVNKWDASKLREQAAAQEHFIDLCRLVEHPTPAELDPNGEFFTFERQLQKSTGGRGRADVWYKGHFAWEYKGKHRDLGSAYAQLLAYRADLGNPPLLVVCDFNEYRIYPQWTNTSGQPFIFRNEDLLKADTRRFINWLFNDPAQFLNLLETELERREKITLDLAYKFAHLADLMRQHRDADGQPAWESMQIARFLTKLVFTLFVEDVGLLPKMPIWGKSEEMPLLRGFLDMVRKKGISFVEGIADLFRAMDGQRPDFIYLAIPYFNGGLFTPSAPDKDDGCEVLDLTLIPGAVDLLAEAAIADWREVNPTIFGTLFEGALDAGKRAQLGAHYTGESDIRLVVEPVLMQPLYREWEQIEAEATPLMHTFLDESAPKRARQEAEQTLINLHNRMMKRLEDIRVLDPACGSGNFLYVSLRALKDLESRVRSWFAPLYLTFKDVVTPRQLYGIEKDEFAARLAHVVCWIGYLQWRYENELGLRPRDSRRYGDDPRQLPSPIIQDKYRPDEPDHILNADAIMRYDTDGKLYEPDWPEVDVIVGNPPFLGEKVMRAGRPELGQAGLGDRYVDDLRALYEDRLPACDLVCYWHEKARAQIEQGKARRAGLLATNSIRGGANRAVLDRVKQTGDIFLAWSDREWVLEGANVRISIVGFDDGSQKEYLLDGAPVDHINSDLQNTIDATKAKPLAENVGLTFQGPGKVGAFDIPDDLAQKMLVSTNPSGRSNADVIKPYFNGEDVVQRSRNYWIIDFGTLSEQEAALYQAPFQYVEQHIKPERLSNRDIQRRTHWWRLGRSGEEYKQAVAPLSRQIFTSQVAKHRLFAWMTPDSMPANTVIAIARDDDYFFGVLHSYLHEIWALRLGTSLEDRPRYTPTTTFETFPFPYPPGREDTNSPAYAAISAAARQLHEEREAWLNPPDLLALGATESSPALRERTLTNLYNALAAYRTPPPNPLPASGEGEKARAGNGNGNGRIPKAARDFAPRLAQLHDALDVAVLAAYGWDDMDPHPLAPSPLHGEGEQKRFALRTVEGDEELLRRLLALNLSRAG